MNETVVKWHDRSAGAVLLHVGGRLTSQLAHPRVGMIGWLAVVLGSCCVQVCIAAVAQFINGRLCAAQANSGCAAFVVGVVWHCWIALHALLSWFMWWQPACLLVMVPYQAGTTFWTAAHNCSSGARLPTWLVTAQPACGNQRLVCWA
jgi:hypothetical protein